MNREASRQVARLDQLIQDYVHRSSLIDEEIMILTQKLRREAEERRELNYYLQEDLEDILYSIEGDPSSMVVIGGSQGGQLQISDKTVVIKGSEGNWTMSLSKVVKEGREDLFEIIP